MRILAHSLILRDFLFCNCRNKTNRNKEMEYDDKSHKQGKLLGQLLLALVLIGYLLTH